MADSTTPCGDISSISLDAACMMSYTILKLSVENLSSLILSRQTLSKYIIDALPMC